MSEYIVEVTGQMPDAIYERELAEIVRCRDCKFFDAPGNIGQWCTLLEFGMENIADGFCAWGAKVVSK